MQGVNAIRQLKDSPWEECKDPERSHWLTLARVGLLAAKMEELAMQRAVCASGEGSQ